MRLFIVLVGVSAGLADDGFDVGPIVAGIDDNEFVAATDWVAVLPGLICVNDIGRNDLIINPIVDPPLYAEFVIIEPARRTLSVQARLFVARLEAEVARVRGVWRQSLAPESVIGEQ